jgi:hypothetical protein
MSFPKQFFDGCPQCVTKPLFIFKAVGSPARHWPNSVPSKVEDLIELRFRQHWSVPGERVGRAFPTVASASLGRLACPERTREPRFLMSG